MSAQTLSWHNAGVDAVFFGRSARRLTLNVEVFRWDVQDGGDAQPGQLVFEDVEGVQTLSGLEGVPLEGGVDWEILDARFEGSGGRLGCRFRLSLPQIVGEGGGPGDRELVVRCGAAWFRPLPGNTP